MRRNIGENIRGVVYLIATVGAVWGVIALLIAIFHVPMANAEGPKRCQKPNGEIILIAPPALCPPGTWEV